MEFTEMAPTELAAVATFVLVALFAVIDGLWPNPRVGRIRPMFRVRG